MTPHAILERLRADREFWRDQEAGADDNRYYAMACSARIEYITATLSWLPKELDRLVIAVRAEEEDAEPDCPNCDETEGHGGECVLRIRVTGADVARDLEWDGALPIGDVINGRRVS